MFTTEAPGHWQNWHMLSSSPAITAWRLSTNSRRLMTMPSLSTSGCVEIPASSAAMVPKLRSPVESAGANLAINVAIAARDAGIDAPVHMALVYPVAGNDMNTPSYRQNADAKPLNRPMMEWFVQQTFNSPSEVADARINLAAADVTKLPNRDHRPGGDRSLAVGRRSAGQAPERSRVARWTTRFTTASPMSSLAWGAVSRRRQVGGKNSLQAALRKPLAPIP